MMKAKRKATVNKKKTKTKKESMAMKNQRKKMENFLVMNLLTAMKKMKAWYQTIHSGSKTKVRIQLSTSLRELNKLTTNKVKLSPKNN